MHTSTTPTGGTIVRFTFPDDAKHLAAPLHELPGISYDDLARGLHEFQWPRKRRGARQGAREHAAAMREAEEQINRRMVARGAEV